MTNTFLHLTKILVYFLALLAFFGIQVFKPNLISLNAQMLIVIIITDCIYSNKCKKCF